MSVQATSTSNTAVSSNLAAANPAVGLLIAETAVNSAIERTNQTMITSFDSMRDLLQANQKENSQLRSDLLASESARKKENAANEATIKSMQQTIDALSAKVNDFASQLSGLVGWMNGLQNNQNSMSQVQVAQAGRLNDQDIKIVLMSNILNSCKAMAHTHS